MASISRAAISIKKVHQRQLQKSKPYAQFSKVQNNNKFTIYTRARIFKGLKNSLISEHLRT